MSSAEIEVLTDSLTSDLNRMNHEMGIWCKEKEAKLSHLTKKHENGVEESEHMIEALKMNHERLDSIYLQNKELESSQTEEIQMMQEKVSQFRNQENNLLPQLSRMTSNENSKKDELHKLGEAISQLRERAENRARDLNEGVFLFSSLGLLFERCGGDGLRFSFKYLNNGGGEEDEEEDENLPNFTLLVNESGEYEIQSISIPSSSPPPLSTSHTHIPPSHPTPSSLIASLNQKNSFSLFVVLMRRFLKEQVNL